MFGTASGAKSVPKWCQDGPTMGTRETGSGMMVSPQAPSPKLFGRNHKEIRYRNTHMIVPRVGFFRMRPSPWPTFFIRIFVFFGVFLYPDLMFLPELVVFTGIGGFTPGLEVV